MVHFGDRKGSPRDADEAGDEAEKRTAGTAGTAGRFGLRVETGQEALAQEPDLPPIVARMVVEIRSDGSRTIARGALEDRITGEKVALHADAATPIALAQQLTGALLRTPALAKQTLSGLLPKALKRRLPFSRGPQK
jgi:hypothetical protein